MIGAQIKSYSWTFPWIIGIYIKPGTELVVANVQITRTNKIKCICESLEHRCIHQRVDHPDDGLLIFCETIMPWSGPECRIFFSGIGSCDGLLLQLVFCQLTCNRSIIHDHVAIGCCFAPDKWRSLLSERGQICNKFVLGQEPGAVSKHFVFLYQAKSFQKIYVGIFA